MRFNAPIHEIIVAERFFVTGVKACPPAEVVSPAPSTALGDAAYVRKEMANGAIDVTAAFRGRHCRVQLSAWYDRDGNGQLSSGDWTGTSAAEEVVNRGVFESNVVRSKDVRLMALP